MINVENPYTIIPTLFELKVREDGWIHDVHLHLSTEIDPLPATWDRRIVLENGSYASVFKLEYIFKNALSNQQATFHYFIEGVEYVCETMLFDVYDFDH